MSVNSRTKKKTRNEWKYHNVKPAAWALNFIFSNRKDVKGLYLTLLHILIQMHGLSCRCSCVCRTSKERVSGEIRPGLCVIIVSSTAYALSLKCMGVHMHRHEHRAGPSGSALRSVQSILVNRVVRKVPSSSQDVALVFLVSGACMKLGYAPLPLQ